MEAVPVSDDEMAAVIWKARVAGAGERQLSKQFGLPLQQIRAYIDAYCPKLDSGRRRRVLGVVLEQLDGLMAAFLPKAMEGCHASAALCLKIAERQTVLTGLEYAPTRTLEAPHDLQPHPQPNSTERVLRLLEQISAEGRGSPQIDGTAEEVHDPSVH